MKRVINVFDKQTEKFLEAITIINCENKIKNYYKNNLSEDPDLIYEYEIEENDKKFFEDLLGIKLNFDKYWYFLSCAV